MCGIFGLISNYCDQSIYKKILNGLEKLQNRGYDSTGIGLLVNNQFIINKYASTKDMIALDKLKMNYPNINNNDSVYIGIGHNRWATHGNISDVNSHPHKSNCDQFMLVHNGIIENYKQLKDFLILNNYNFISETDSEVIVNLISFYYKKYKDTYNAFKKTIYSLEGTYAIILIDKNDDKHLYCVNNGSSLLVGISDNFIVISSEQTGFCNNVEQYIILSYDDICIVTRKNNEILINSSCVYEKKKALYDDYSMIKPNPFKHWTIKEIYEQPNVVEISMNYGARFKNDYEVKLGGLDNNYDNLFDIDNLILLGCGSSYFAGQYVMQYFKSLCEFNTVQILDGANFDICDVPKYGKTALILISQSGETKDMFNAIKIAKDNNLMTIGVINTVNSYIAREVVCGVYLNAGREIGVASTKTFITQIVCLSMIAIWFSQIKKINELGRKTLISDLHILSKNIKNTIDNVNDKIIKISKNIINNNMNNIYIVGKGNDETIAKEGSLKIKEIAYIHAEGYSISSLRHGPIALLNDYFPVIILNCHQKYFSKIMNSYQEIKSRTNEIIVISSSNMMLNKDDIIIDNNDSFQSLLAIIPLQLLAYYLSIEQNINPDLPKNLAKVITVE